MKKSKKNFELKKWKQKLLLFNRYLLNMYIEAVEALSTILSKRLQGTNNLNNGPLYVGEYKLKSGAFVPEMDHLVGKKKQKWKKLNFPRFVMFLACWLLGLKRLEEKSQCVSYKWRKVKLKFLCIFSSEPHEDLMETCYGLYETQLSGIGPERVQFRDNSKLKVMSSKYLLRPGKNISGSIFNNNIKKSETIESLFVLYRITLNETYREWGWNIFQVDSQKIKNNISNPIF